MKYKFSKLAVTLGLIAGLLMILAGILTALKITPPIAAVGQEIGLGIWRVFAGLIITGGAYIAIKNPKGYWAVIVLGIFEVIVLLSFFAP